MASTKDSLPEISAIIKAKDIVDNPESAKYLLDAVVAKIKKFKAEGVGAEIVEILKNNYEYWVSARQEGNIWSGEAPAKTPVENYYNQMLRDAAPLKTTEPKAITVGYAIQPDSTIQIGYGGGLNEEEEKDLDNVFQAWLLKNDMEVDDKVIYGVSTDGKKAPVSAAAFKEKIDDPNNGFAQAVKKFNNAYEVNTKDQSTAPEAGLR